MTNMRYSNSICQATGRWVGKIQDNEKEMIYSARPTVSPLLNIVFRLKYVLLG